MSYDLGTAHGKIELEYEGRKEAAEADKDMRKLERHSKDTDKAMAGLGKRFSSFLGGAGSAARIGAIGSGFAIAGVQAANLGVQVLGIVPALTSILSLSSALPAAFAGGVAAIGTLKAITAGLSDTFKAAFDPEGAKKFEESLKRLSPAAQEFAKAVKANVEPLKEYQKGIQEAFFSNSGLTQAVPKAMAMLNTLRPQIQGMARDFAAITKQLIRFATESRTVSFLEESIRRFREGLRGASSGLTPMLQGLRAVGEVGAPLIERLGNAIGGVAAKFGNWLSEIAASGQLQEWINTAIGTLKTLGTIAGNIGSILNDVFRAAGQTGGGLLNTIATLTGEFADFLNTSHGMEVISGLFKGIGDVARQLAPVITTLVGALAGALGPALSRIATDIGPVLLQVVENLAPAFAPLADAIASVLAAVAPLAPPLATLIALLAQGLGNAIQALVAELGPFISIIAQTLVEAFRQLTPFIGQFAALLPVAAEAGLELARAFAPLMPIIVEFARVLAEQLVAVMPQIIDLIRQAIPIFAQLATVMAGQMQDGLGTLTALLPALIQGFVAVAPIVLRVIGFFVQLLTWARQLGLAIRSLGETVTAFVERLAGGIMAGLTAAYNGVVSVGGSIISWFQALPGRVLGFLQALPGMLWNLITGMMQRAAFIVGAGIGLIITAVVRLPPLVMGAIRALPGLVWNLLTSLWNNARNIFNTGVTAAVAVARRLPGLVAGAIRSIITGVPAIARSAWNALKNAFSSGISAAVALARSLPGRIRSAIGNLAGMMAGMARDAIAGFVNGIRNGIGAVGAAARSLGSSVLSGIKSTLKIGSPSKAMIAIGRFVTQGLHNGLMGSAKQVQAAATKIANMVNDAFRNGLISRGQRNSAINSIVSGNRQLVKLANQSATTAARLKTAQSNLANITKSYNDVYASAVQKTKDTFSLITSGQRFVDLDRTKARFQQAVQQAKDFAKNIQNLSKRGLSKDLLQQLVDAGAADGGAMAASLAAASDATLKEFNNLQGQLNSSAATVGKVTADALYGAGLKAAQGLVKGLQNQQAAIQKQMDKIADAMVARLKRALKIKSPSRIMFDIGRFIPEGLVDGINSLRRQVTLAAQKLATASIIPTVQLTAQEGVRQAFPTARLATPASSPQFGIPEGQRTYTLQIGDKTFMTMVLDALTGAPVEVKKVNDEGSRRSAWAGNGR